MSLTSYIGSNVPIAVRAYDDEVPDHEIFVGRRFANEDILAEVKEAQFSTKHVYEVTLNWWGIELTSYQDEKVYEENKIGMHQLCNMMDAYLQDGDFFEFYTCWVGDEFTPREAEMTLPMHGWFTEGMELGEQTLIRFNKIEL